MVKKVTFPHMGNLNIGMKALFKETGINAVIPPDNSKKTLDLGVKYSPEHACLPLKITLGNFIEALEKGANLILMGGGQGPCRFGYYGEVQKEILRDLGYEFEMICLEPELKKMYKKFRELFKGCSFKDIFNGLKLALKKLSAIDKVDQVVAKNRGREEKEGQIDSIFTDYLKKIDQASTFKKIKELEENHIEKIKTSVGRYKRGIELKIGIVGEIYLVIEPFANLEIEKKLGNLGVSVAREIYITTWLKEFLNIGKHDRIVKKFARSYLKNFVGGHGIHTVGDTVRYSRDGFDGVIQIGPFTCMPEIVAKTILNEVEEKENISTLSFFMDEHRGEAGFKTRLEAFVDLLERKKRDKSA
ncbi:MAG: acyl-CoA dehydratase activase-related protein [Bacillota bacterium]